MQYLSLLQSLPALRPWLPWYIVASVCVVYMALVQCLDHLFVTIIDWNGLINPITLLSLVVGAGLITVPLYHATYVSVLMLCGAWMYILVLLHYVIIHEHLIWVAPLARILGVINVCVGMYITMDVAMGLQSRRMSIWNAFRVTLPVLLLPQVLAIVLTDPQY
jgi:hypothetical protein